MDSNTKLSNTYTTKPNEMKTAGENMKYIKHIYLLRVPHVTVIYGTEIAINDKDQNLANRPKMLQTDQRMLEINHNYDNWFNNKSSD